MEETVYADIYFLINFSMDFLCLFLTARLMSEKLRLGRISAASVFGGVYAVAALLILPSGVWAVAFDIFACVVISLIAFLKRGRLRSTLGLAVAGLPGFSCDGCPPGGQGEGLLFRVSRT